MEMKKGLRAVILFAACFACSLVVSAATISIASTGGAPATQFNNSPDNIPAPYANAETVAVSPNPGWAAALPGSQWVSFYQTGIPLSYIVPDDVTVTFTHLFFLDEFFSATGSVTVRADDSTSVWLNGHLLFAEASQDGNGYSSCSDSPIGCLPATQKTLDLTGYLLPGENALQFGVSQRKGSSYGLNYAGVVTTATPEPSTFALLGLGLLGGALLSRRSHR